MFSFAFVMNEKSGSESEEQEEEDKKMSTKRGFIRENYHILRYDVLRFYCMNINAFTQSTRQHPEWCLLLVTSEHPLFTFPRSRRFVHIPTLFLLLLVFVWGRNAL